MRRTICECNRTYEECMTCLGMYYGMLPRGGKPQPKSTSFFNVMFRPGSENAPVCRHGRSIDDHEREAARLARNGRFFVPTFATLDGMGESTLQAGYTALDNKFVCGGDAILRDTHAKVVLSSNGTDYKPDCTIYSSNQETAKDIVAIIELTSPTNADGSNAIVQPKYNSQIIVQLTAILAAILNEQKHRSFIYGVLTNHRYLLAVQAHRESKDTIAFTLRYAGTFKEQWIEWLCTASMEELGMVTPKVTLNGTNYSLDTFLGSAQYGDDYELLVEGRTPIVVKHFRNEEVAQRERDVCGILTGVKGVTQLYAHQPTEAHLVAITPKGIPFDVDHRLTEAHVTCLHRALQELHKKGKVHGEISSSNIYYVNANEALLSDWSHVRDIDEESRFTDLVKLLRAIWLLSDDTELQVKSLTLLDDAPPKKAAKKTADSVAAAA